MKPKNPVLGVIFGNRDFFPDKLVAEARADLEKLFAELGLEAVMLGTGDTKLGGVETFDDSLKCSQLFRANRDRIGGVLVVLPNFGDEKGVADTLKMAELNVPVLVQAYPDSLDQLDVVRRRDGFCGKISVCNDLRQAGIPYSLTRSHTVSLQDPEFKKDMEWFLGVCRVVKGIRTARIGAFGARPGAFCTMRYSEKLLARSGVTVATVDLSEIIGKAGKLAEDDAAVKAKIASIRGYANADAVPPPRLVQMARLGVILDRYMTDLHLDASAIQCWTSLQQNHGCNVCTSMSMMSENFQPSACEVDVTGVLTMYAMQLASGTPSALVDWNNNYGGDANRCVLFHCGNWAKSFLPDIKILNAPILGSTLGVENTYGALDGRTPAGPLTYARLTTDDSAGQIRAYVGQGEFTNDELKTFGNRAVAKIPDLQKLMHYVCRNGFEHHVAISGSHTASILAEAWERYLGWGVYNHSA